VGYVAVIVATEEGRHAYREGRPMMDNPYAEGSPEHLWWIEGWRMEWWGEKCAPFYWPDKAGEVKRNDGRR
jgi:hypothetical protein